MRNRRDRRKSNYSVKFITNRVTYGIPFVPNRIINHYIKAIMAKGQHFYPTQVTAFTWMGNHYHIIISGTSKHISPFIGYIQAEIAKVIKRVTNCYETNIWKTRFKEQNLATSKDVIKYLIYLYANPVSANLIKKVNDYPGVNSYNMLTSNSNSYLIKFIPVRYARLIKGEFNSIKKYKELLSKNTGYLEFKLFPFIWKRYFSDTKNKTDQEILNEILEGIKEIEEENKDKAVIGRKRLINSRINTSYKPKKNSSSPYIICSNRTLRKRLIKEYQHFVKKCREAYQELKEGIKKVVFPLGAYIPSSGLIPLHL